MGEENKKISKEEVIAKLKDDGDFDKLRLKITRKLKDNEELRNSIIAAVKQSAALNQPGAENMKLRQLSDAIHDEVGNKVMGQISDSLWGIIRSEGGMRSEITETVQSVYGKLANPRGKEKGESSIHEVVRVEKESENNGAIKATTRRVDETLSDAKPKEPPGFSLSNNRHTNHRQQQQKEKQQLPRPYNGAVENSKEQPSHSQVGREEDDVDVGVPPGFSEDIEQKQPCDVSDEDPDVPPGFG
ncbi:modifier of snc1 9 [Hibiscus trionum]|uniref:Modifier of snc1 9 n=1 Tax=Hibiscus trionum TaxID=183268 RepID=A0A9W7MHQ6_HIBTR|nr:modifier of snc1 9 [Hibiscus trionum]